MSVEIRDEHKHLIRGYTMAESLPIERNRLAAPTCWISGKGAGELRGRPRLHVAMRLCKLYLFPSNLTD